MNDPDQNPFVYWRPVIIMGLFFLFCVFEPAIKKAWVQHEHRVALEKFREERAAEGHR